MSGVWVVRSGAVTCGYDGAEVPAGEPVYAMPGSQPRYRCADHAPRPVDDAQVDASRRALADAHTKKFHTVLRRDAGIRGVQTAPGLKPFSDVADHPAVRRTSSLD